MQDLLAGADIGGGGGSRTKDNELAKVMFEGSQQHRRKLKLPDMNDAAEKIKEAVSALEEAVERRAASQAAMDHRWQSSYLPAYGRRS